MRYKWNRTLIKEQLKRARMYVDENPIFETDIEYLESMLVDDATFFPRSSTFQAQLQEDADWVNKYPDFYNHFYQFSTYKDIIPRKMIDMSPVKFTNCQPLYYVHDFYNSLGGVWQKNFNLIYRDRKDNYQVKGDRGYSVFLPGNNYSYISVPVEEDITAFINVAHEYAHSIADRILFREYDDSDYPFIELPPLFFELAIGDFIAQDWKGSDDLIVEDRLATAKSINMYCCNLVNFTRFLVDVAEEEREIPTNKQKTIDEASERLDITKADATRMFVRSKKEELEYTIPYLTALELYYIYKQDPKEALDLLKRIIVSKRKHNYVSYLEGLHINLNEHSEEHVKELVKMYK